MAIAILVSCCVCPAQVFNSSGSSVDRKKLEIVVAASSASYVVTLAGLNQLWYSQTPRSPFHFFNDMNEWKQMDKVGHFYSAFQVATIGTSLFRWTGLKQEKSDRIAALTSLGIMASIEVMDGFSSAYGASLPDMAANTIGVGFFLGQEILWKEQRIYPKFSFHKTSFAPQRPNELGTNLVQQIIKDYNGQTEWLSFDLDKFCRFPKWLNLSLGYGIENMIYAMDARNIQSGLTPYRQFYISLDFDLTAFRSRSKLINTLIFFVNMIKIPAPALEFSKGRLHGHAMYF
jgi:uncharacterized protein YfiM (DUF2279 family)